MVTIQFWLFHHLTTINNDFILHSCTNNRPSCAKVQLEYLLKGGLRVCAGWLIKTDDGAGDHEEMVADGSSPEPYQCWCGCRFRVDLFLATANHLITVTADTQYCTRFEITCHVNFNLNEWNVCYLLLCVLLWFPIFKVQLFCMWWLTAVSNHSLRCHQTNYVLQVSLLLREPIARHCFVAGPEFLGSCCNYVLSD